MRTLAVLLAVTVLTSQPAFAQSAPPASPPASAGDGVPVSLARIKRQLGQAPPAREDEGLRLAYYLNVYGKLPDLELFRDFDPAIGPVPYGAPSHKELIQMVTPQMFRAPVMDLSNVGQAIAQWLAKRAAEKKAR